MNDYDPDAMFPKKPRPERFWTGERIMRWTIIVGLSAFAIFVGAGCKSLVNVKDIDLGFGGLEIEFYEPPPVIVQTNLINLEADVIPRLMQRTRK